MRCRHCEAQLVHTCLDLGFAPPSNAYLTEQDLCSPESYYPLRVKVCEECWLVQTEDYAQAADLFKADYAYFSSTSASWLDHAYQYFVQITRTLALNANSQVIELASNDGYLLRHFVAAGIPCLGIEPTEGTASVARQQGVPVICEFFSAGLAERLLTQCRAADLIIGNNVFAHVPNINDFTQGIKLLLKPGGTVTLEFPHLFHLIENCQFDTVYHEHFSYLSLHSVMKIFRKAGLKIFDVEEIPTHGGSLRIFGCHETDLREIGNRVSVILSKEKLVGLTDIGVFKHLQGRSEKIKDDLLHFLIEQKRIGRRVAGYGAAAKGNTLLNFAGIKPDLLPFVCDAALAKQGKYMPGSHIPILSPAALVENQLDFLLILPWNLADELRSQLSVLRSNGTRFITAIPHLEII